VLSTSRKDTSPAATVFVRKSRTLDLPKGFDSRPFLYDLLPVAVMSVEYLDPARPSSFCFPPFDFPP